LAWHPFAESHCVTAVVGCVAGLAIAKAANPAADPSWQDVLAQLPAAIAVAG
jgi:hypothetical protein